MGTTKIYIFLLLFAINVTYSQKIKWLSLDEALKAQKIQPKKIIMDVYTKWCGPCRLLDKKTFGNPDVSRYISQNFYAVKFNAEGDEEIFFYDKKYSNPNYNPDKVDTNERSYNDPRFAGPPNTITS